MSVGVESDTQHFDRAECAERWESSPGRGWRVRGSSLHQGAGVEHKKAEFCRTELHVKEDRERREKVRFTLETRS